MTQNSYLVEVVFNFASSINILFKRKKEVEKRNITFCCAWKKKIMWCFFLDILLMHGGLILYFIDQECPFLVTIWPQPMTPTFWMWYLVLIALSSLVSYINLDYNLTISDSRHDIFISVKLNGQIVRKRIPNLINLKFPLVSIHMRFKSQWDWIKDLIE